MVAVFRIYGVAALLAVVGACSASEQNASRIDNETHIAIGVKGGPMTVLTLDAQAMAFTSRQDLSIDNVNYIRTSTAGKTFVLRPNTLTVLDTKDLAQGRVTTLADTQALPDPTAVEVSANEQVIYSAHWADSMLSARVFDGENFLPPQEFECGWAHQFRPHPNGKWAYAACMKNTLKQFSIEQGSFQVLPMVTPSISIEGGPRHLEFHPSGDTLYVLLQTSSQVAVFDIDTATGELIQPPKQIINSTEDGSKNQSSDLHITPNGKWLYAFNRKNQNMAVFSVLPNLSLKFEKTIPMAKGEVRDWAMSPNGVYLVTASNEGHVSVWSIDDTSGGLILAAEHKGLGNAISVALID